MNRAEAKKRRDKSSREIRKGGKSMELRDKGWLLQMAQVQRRPFERCDSVKRETEGPGGGEERDKGSTRRLRPVG